MKIELHVTDLDSMVWFRKIEDMTVGEMRGRLLRTEPANEKMKMGTAWHSVLEDPPETIDMIERDGITFRVECAAEITIPQVREIRAVKTYRIDGAEVTLTGGCDGISGNKITDHKLTFNPNPETYFESFQWRAYLDIFGADSFKYIIYSATEKKGEIIIRDVSTLVMYRYPEMVNDLEEGIRDLLTFVKDHVPEMIRA